LTKASFTDNIPMTVAQSIVSQALSLSPNERADIANVLLQSLELPQDYETEWMNLVEKRHQEVQSGKVKPITWHEMKSKIRQK